MWRRLRPAAVLGVALLTGAFSGASAQAAGFPKFSGPEFQKLPRSRRAAVLRAYRTFIGQLETANPNWFAEADRSRELFASLLRNAEADEITLDCFNAGWPNDLVPDDPVKGKCPGPGRGAGLAFYQQFAADASCAAGETPCMPLLFGKGVCYDPKVGLDADRKGPSWAWAGCTRNSKASLDDITNQILDNPKYGAGFQQLQTVAEAACRETTPPRPSAPMCRSLVAHLSRQVALVDAKTADLYDCYKAALKPWQEGLKLADHPSWSTSGTSSELNTCGEFGVAPAREGASPTTQTWCYGLPDDFIAMRTTAASRYGAGVLLTKVSQDSKYGDRSSHFVAGDGSADQLKGLMNLSWTDFKAIWDKTPSQPYTSTLDYNAHAVAAMVSGIGAQCAKATADDDLAECQKVLEGCSDVAKANSEIRAAAKTACAAGRMAATPACSGIIQGTQNHGAGTRVNPGGD